MREKGNMMHFEQVQRKGGWMDYGGNTMEWNPPESKNGWDVKPVQLEKSQSLNDLDHWNRRTDGSDYKFNRKKARYDHDTFSRGSSSSSLKKPNKSVESARKESNVSDKKPSPGIFSIIKPSILSYCWAY
jgi:hypothetical protein